MPRKSTTSKDTPAGKKSIKSTAAKKGALKTTPPEVEKKQETGHFPVVGVGASAGGLEALEGFFSHAPANTNMAFVIIQHLDPRHKSIMASILGNYTDINVVELTDGMRVEPNTIYLNPPNKIVDILNGVLHLSARQEVHGSSLPIDYFFRSLSEDQKERGICVILSGTGTDGTIGLKAVKAGGGMAMVQDENQAKYDGMPRSAIDTGLVDYVLPVEKMVEEILKYVRHPYIEHPEKAATAEELFKDYLPKIFTLIRSSTGHDFSNYKMTTIRRRIERRMAVHHIDRIADYVHYMRQDRTEVETLFKELLITVTNFFRDPDAFDILEKKVLPEMLKERDADAPIRVWVPGCATGEEAYSLAMIIVEAMQKYKKHFNVQIFATDIDPDAINYGRIGIYPDSISADVSPERLRQFFNKENNTYRIKKQIREMVVFAVQNVIKDPPFSKLDMVSCRNLLIYFNSSLQKKVIPLLHYTLYQDGILFLGPSESLGEFSDLFSIIDSKWKIFKRKGAGPRRTEDISLTPSIERRREVSGDIKKLTNFKEFTEKEVLEYYSPPCVLINEKFNILYFHGNTQKYLRPPTGEPIFNILNMVNRNLEYQLSATLHRTLKDRKETVTEVRLQEEGKPLVFDLIVKPFFEHSAREGMLLLIFNEKSNLMDSGEPRKRGKVATEEVRRLATLEQELQSTKEYLQTTIEELQTSNEELKSANEELQSANEELQSTNEELETSKEELQSTNEELTTVNSELQNKVDELARSNNDLSNLLASTEIGTIFLDTGLRIKRFTPSVTKIFNLIKSDFNRPLSDITTTIVGENLYRDAQNVLDTLHTKEAEVKTQSGNRYAMKVMPYRTVDNVIDGVVLTFSDITGIRKTEEMLEESEDKYRNLVNKSCKA